MSYKNQCIPDAVEEGKYRNEEPFMLETLPFSSEDILSAYHEHQFFLEYLPTVRLTDECCVGAEALLRWQRNERIVPPIEFLPLIEGTYLNGLIACRVVELVGKDLGPWLHAHAKEDIHIAINVPPALIGRGGLNHAALTSGLQGVMHKLMAEISERGLPDALSIASINEAKRYYGLPFALDDVNMNVASMMLLMHVQADVVKFDKSFADQLLQDEWSEEISDRLAAVVRADKYKVIVEGVETSKQVKILKEAGVHMAQGWYFSPSLKATDFMSYFAMHQH